MEGVLRVGLRDPRSGKKNTKIEDIPFGKPVSSNYVKTFIYQNSRIIDRDTYRHRDRRTLAINITLCLRLTQSIVCRPHITILHRQKVWRIKPKHLRTKYKKILSLIHI